VKCLSGAARRAGEARAYDGSAARAAGVTLDVLTDALVLVGQHGVYCQSSRRPGKPAMDIQLDFEVDFRCERI